MDKQINYIVFEGRRWFDKVNGNTYHSRKVTVTYSDDSKDVLINNFSYGYGNDWFHQSLDDLVKAGIFESKSDANDWLYNNRNKWYETVSDGLKRDLKFN